MEDEFSAERHGGSLLTKTTRAGGVIETFTSQLTSIDFDIADHDLFSNGEEGYASWASKRPSDEVWFLNRRDSGSRSLVLEGRLDPYGSVIKGALIGWGCSGCWCGWLDEGGSSSDTGVAELGLWP